MIAQSVLVVSAILAGALTVFSLLYAWAHLTTYNPGRNKQQLLGWASLTVAIMIVFAFLTWAVNQRLSA